MNMGAGGASQVVHAANGLIQNEFYLFVAAFSHEDLQYLWQPLMKVR